MKGKHHIIKKVVLDNSIKQIKKLEKIKDDNQKQFYHTYIEYKKFKYSTETKSLTLDF